MIGIAAAICIGLSPVSQDPYLVWMYASLAIVSFVAGFVFYVCFRNSDSVDMDGVGVVDGVPLEQQVTQVAEQGKRNDGV